MSDQQDNLMLNLLRAIRSDNAEIKAGMVEVEKRLGLLKAQCPSVSRRVDRLVGDAGRIKRRLDIIDTPAT